MLKAVDGTSSPSVNALKAAGVGAVYRYIALGTSNKHLTKAELNALTAAGIKVGLVAESTQTQMAGGKAAGEQDARMVLGALSALGLPTTQPVFYAHDQDGAQSYILGYLEGVATVAGRDSVGIYGGIDACRLARTWYAKCGVWQTLAWSGSALFPEADAYQGGGHAWGGSYADYHVTIGGVNLDKDTAFTNWGLIGGEETMTDAEVLAAAARAAGFGTDVTGFKLALQAAKGLRLWAHGDAAPSDADVKLAYDKLKAGGGGSTGSKVTGTFTGTLGG